AFEVSAVGADSYAEKLTGEARGFRHPRSPLERALNRLLLFLVAVMVPLGATIGYALWERKTPLHEAVPTSVAAVVTMVPEGLILLASLTYAVAALRIARRGGLAQQLNAIESLASVDVVCLDKTGPLAERAESEAASGRRVLALSRGGTQLELTEELPRELVSLGLVLLAEQLRTDARETVAFFRAQGVELKILSGDRPETVAAIARD